MPDQPADRIHLRDYLVTTEIGAFAAEHGAAQRLRFAVEAELARRGSGAGDDVDRVLSYDTLVAAVNDALAERRFDLLEALAEGIATRVLGHGGVAAVQVTIEKLDRVPGALGVTIARRAGEAALSRPQRPTLPVLRQGASQPSGGAIIVPDPPGLPLPKTGDTVQLGLLALDQGAWALAGQLGVGVAATRTELEAAAASGTTVVWAPARMVREARDLAAGGRLDPQALAEWLVRRLEGAPRQ